VVVTAHLACRSLPHASAISVTDSDEVLVAKMHESLKRGSAHGFAVARHTRFRPIRRH
jgi:hypothetical protein